MDLVVARPRIPQTEVDKLASSIVSYAVLLPPYVHTTVDEADAGAHARSVLKKPAMRRAEAAHAGMIDY
jgi:hypothetical protein